MKNIFLVPFIFILACSNKNTPNVDHHNTRNFQFIYEVEVEPTQLTKEQKAIEASAPTIPRDTA